MEDLPRILVVDDETLMTESIRLLLQAKDLEVRTCNDPLEALALFEQTRFALVLLDVMMPGMNGFQLMDAMKRRSGDTVFIIMTGDATMESAVKAIRNGASDYIKKPFEPEELIIRVENVLKQIRLKAERCRIELEKESLEKQLIQSQKMEAIGTLTGGIAHDFNNILAIILGNAELAKDAVSEDHQVHQWLEKIYNASLKARELIQQLLSFSRKQESEKRLLRLNSVVLDSLNLLRASIPTNIKIEHDIPEDLYVVSGDITQIHQIMLNLCTNSSHAMQPAGGVLTVRMDNCYIEDRFIGRHGNLSPGKYIRLVVTDTGHGIDSKIIDRIFDPYFTTKEPGKGTGMGLSMVHGIVKSHGGDIRVCSKPGISTEFHIFLPAAESDISETGISTTEDVPKGSEKILMIDDEDMVAEVMKQMMEKLGYRVSTCSDSTQAFEIFRHNPDAYDLIITDMTMPNMTGDLLAEKIRSIKPGIPIILCTGYNEQIDAIQSSLSSINEIVMKPVGMKELAKKIRSVIDYPAKERRKEKRFKIRQSVFVVSKFNPSKQGELIDVSASGLSFQYTKNGDAPRQFERLSILSSDKILMEDFPFKTVSECGIQDRSMNLIRLGGEFRRLTPFHEDRLDSIIRKYAVVSS